MKTIQHLFKSLILTVLGTGLAVAQCGNGSVGGTGGTGYPKEPKTCESDPVVPHTGNEFKEIDDLKVWGGVGEAPLFWKRHANSRWVGGREFFGMGHYWRHSYQWEFAALSNDESGRARRMVITPEGGTWEFTQMNSTTWVGPVGCEAKLIPQGDDYIFLAQDSKRYLFKKFVWGPTTLYLMTEFHDAQGNRYKVDYDDWAKVTKVTEPAGRFLSVTYQTKLANCVDFVHLGHAPAATPASGEWVEIPVTETTPHRYVRLVTADGAYGNIAEVEFYDELNQKLSGTVISSDSIVEAQKALDGNSSTGFVSGSLSGSFVGLDLGVAKRVSRIRFLPVAGKEVLMNPSLWAYFPPSGSAADEAPVSTTVISRVETSDGRAVDYTYANFNDPSVPYRFVTLTEAVYGDGTKGTYKYGQIFASQKPLVTEWNDVRYGLRQPKYKTVYQAERARYVLGMVDKQVNLETGGTIAAIGIYQDDLHIPTVTFANGKVIRQEMSMGFMAHRYDGNLNRVDYTYGANGFLATETDSLGRVTSYTRSSLGNILTTTHPDGTVETWTRNALDSVIAYQDALNRITTYTRDAQNRVTRVDYPDASFETVAYNGFSQITQKRFRNGGVQNYTYDSRGLLTQETDPLGNVTSFAYDSSDRLNSITDARNQTTTMAYNERGLMVQQTNPDGSVKSYTYQVNGDLLTATNELGNTTTYTYDIFRRVKSVTDPLGRTTTKSYLADSYEDKPLEVILPSGKKTVIVYDKEWNPVAVASGVGTVDAATTNYLYDKVYNLVKTVDARGKESVMTYDHRNRKITAVDPLGNTTQWTYDFVGNMLTAKDALNRVTTNIYDSINRVVSTTDAKNQTTTFFYDQSSNLIKMVDAKGNAYQNAFDLLNRKTAMIYPDNSKEQYGYDSVSNTVTYITRAGETKTCTFDNRNREILCDWSDATPDTSRTFDALGRLLTSNNGLSNISYTYNAANELLSELTQLAGGQPRAVAYTYTVDGNRASVTYPGGTVVSYGYTGRNQINAINKDAVTLATYSYDLNGNRIQKSLENGTSTDYSFDDASRLTGLTDKKGATTLLSTGYTLNAVGNRTAKLQGGASENYSFDAIDQVTGVNYNNTRNVSYDYDSVGNRTSVIDNAVTTNYSTNNLNQYTSVGGVAHGSDGNGNLVSGQGIFLYDSYNRLTQAVVGANTVQFTYDSKNRVIKRTTNGVPLFLVYDGWSLIEERDASGTVLQKYVNGVNIDEILVKINAVSAVYYHRDGLGSVTQLTDSLGNIVEKYTYDIFGKASIIGGLNLQPIASSLQANRFQFTGREWLSEVGLYDYRNRIYSCELGRFLQTDPIRFSAGDVNIYRYCFNNAIFWTDPFGLASRQSRSLDGMGGMKGGNLRHDRFKYNDGSDSGYYDDGKIRPDKPENDKRYSDDVKNLDDNTLRQAEQNVKDNGWENTPYNANPFDDTPDHQCQNYADEVMKEYDKLKKEQEEKDKCKK